MDKTQTEVPVGNYKKTSLRSFQNELAVRIATRSDVQEEAPQLGMIAGGRRWLCRLQGVSEILFPSAITPVPMAQPWFLGLTNVRGNLHSVIDFAQFLGDDAGRVNDESRLILFGQAGNDVLNLALLVQQVYGLRALKSFTPADAEPSDPAWCTRHWKDADGNRWSELDLLEFIHDAKFQHLGR